MIGLGVHFHGLEHYSFWIDHWAAYPLIVGIALFLRALKTKRGFFISIILIGISLLMIFTIQIPEWFQWIYTVLGFLEQYWPIVLILIGAYILIKRK
ncbi:hypothetical protein [Paracerasibacillus soli]|uniref:DUF5668 domain-containing protein n=1 Tax=Paracerasibacillus soli TaxID=480284 RepID=A0ABU5CT48_9BACI|nr:hypothetical protein [Virgibacillus soli]MDY0408593.1 hypothetical protein [Virgibacillus soli]